MTLEIWLVYVAAILAMMATPGPSQLLILGNSVANGAARAAFTGAGDLCANLLQMLAAGLGLAAILAASENALIAVRIAGALYLLILGIRAFRRASDGRAADRPLASRAALWRQGFFTSATNPKAVVFFAALFPQFITPDAPFWPQFAILSLTYLVIDGLILSAYAIGAAAIVRCLSGRARLWAERAGATAMILAAALLAIRGFSR
ncbi:MAG: LysE family translocator [Pseudomonadota bacterium]